MDLTPTGAGRRLAPPPAPSGVTAINVTPLIDVLLVLFIVYLVIVIFGRHTVPLTVPAPEAGGPAPQVTLEISGEGAYALNGQPIPAGLLGPILQAAFRDRPVKLIFIRTSPLRPYQDFITAADIARGAGVTMVALVGSGIH